MLLENPARFQAKLMRWYKMNARDLPWRRTKDPYKIWISEIMLQQTQVETAIPYYEKWLKRFPTLRSLAKARLHEVLRFWAGLGYYRRARMIHEAAAVILRRPPSNLKRTTKDLKSQRSFASLRMTKRIHFPTTSDELQELPGVGRTTAGAIASIAFGEAAPILDGNVKRVLSRLVAMKESIDGPRGEEKLWKISELLVGAGFPRHGRARGPRPYIRGSVHPGDFNQGLMELGATLCLKQNPKCGLCPVTEFCEAHKLGRVLDFPVRSEREHSQKIRTAALILRQNGKVLIQRQPSEGRWGGLWMFPHWKNKKAMMQHVSAPVNRRMTIHHGFTKYRVRLDVYEPILHPGGVTKLHPRGVRWVRTRDLAKFAFPAPHQKIVDSIVRAGLPRPYG